MAPSCCLYCCSWLTLTLLLVVVEGRPHNRTVMIYMTSRGYVTRQRRPRVNPCTAIERNSRRRQTPRLMDLQYRLPARSSPSFRSNRTLLRPRSRTCKGRRALSSDRPQTNRSTESVMDQSHLGRRRFVAIATSVVRPTLVVSPTTSIKSMSLLARTESRRLLVQR
jgi:hypothetical protein